MAHSKIVFENPNTGHIKEAPVGFSWTLLLFGFFVPMIRGSWKWLIIMFFASIASLGISNLVFPFIFNKIYVKELISTGFKAKSSDTGNLEDISSKLGIKLPALGA